MTFVHLPQCVIYSRQKYLDKINQMNDFNKSYYHIKSRLSSILIKNE